MMGRDEQIRQLLTRNVGEVIEKNHLEESLKSGKKLRVKLGIDPTSPDLHLGHSVVLRKLKEFQELGHKIILIIGDFTGRIGDPSGRSEARRPLTEREIKDNMKEYLRQAGKIIDVKKAEISYNSKWLSRGGIGLAVELASAGSIQQVLHRADFKKRISEDKDVTILEILYPLFQGYDSVAVKADVEIGGTDQTFNLLMGRRVQRHFKMNEQDILTVPLLEGLDGVKKMSKSLGNYIGLSETADQIFGKIMSIPDGLVPKYFELCVGIDSEEFKKLKDSLSPRDLKARLGYEIAKIYQGEKAAAAAKERFDKLFSKKEIPDDIPVLDVKDKNILALDLVTLSGFAESKSEARRLIMQGGFEVNGKKLMDPQGRISLNGGDVLKIGKKNFFRIK